MGKFRDRVLAERQRLEWLEHAAGEKLLTVGMTNAAPVPRAGQMAPKR
jgi:hypothetical protein